MWTMIRNGVRSNLRARGRTALFTGLIWALTLALVLALGVRLYCSAAMEQCAALYRSIAQVEYMGAEYPNADEPDEFARAARSAIDVEAVCAIDGVKSWVADNRSFAYVEGYTRRGGTLPYKNRAVIVVSHISHPVYETYYTAPPMAEWTDEDIYWNEEDLQLVTTDRISYYTAIMGPILYSYENKADISVALLPGDEDFVLEKGKAYVVHGTFLDEGWDTVLHGVRNFKVLPFPDSDARPWAEYNSSTPVDEIFTHWAEQYRVMNSFVEVTTCPDIEDLWEFQQGQLYLASGRMPEAADECIVSGDLMRALHLQVDGTIRTAALASDENDRYAFSLTDQQETLRVVGTVNELDGYSGRIWRVGASDNEAPLFGYLMGTAALESDKAADAVEAMEQLMPDNVRITLLDQGYADAVEPFRSMESTATRVLAICAAGMAAVLLLFAFLYIARQSAAVKIMVSLGTPRKGITAWLLSGALVISAGAAIVGGGMGSALLPLLFRAVQALAEERSGVKLRFSETVLGVAKEVALRVSTPFWPVALLVTLVVLAALGLCLLFLRSAYRGGTLRRGKSRVRVPRGKTSAAMQGSVRFAALSIRRGGWRSAVVPVVSAALTVTLLFLSGIYRGWQKELQTAVDNTTLEGQVTSSSGRLFSGLVIPITTVQQLWALDDVEEMYLSFRWPYYMPDEMPEFGDSSFAQERREAWIARQPDVVAVNGLKGAKEFYFTEPMVTWMDGWDESCLAASYPAETGTFSFREENGLTLLQYNDPWPAVVSDRFLDSRSLAMGDTLSVMCNNMSLYIQIVGVYKQSGNRPHIYVPLAKYIEPDYIFGDGLPEVPDGAMWFWGAKDYSAYQARSATFSTCRFTLASARRLDETRQALYDAGFSWPEHLRSIRTTLLLRDASFIKITESLGRYLAMGRVMLALIFAMVAVLGFIISWLMVHGRKQEFAIMRGFGAKRGQVFRAFFLEQALLCLAGCLIGCVYLLRPGFDGGVLSWAVLAGYLISYLAGCAVSVKITGRTKLMELLAARE